MSEHLTAEQVEKYRKRGLLPAGLLAFDRHLSQCPGCRKQLPGKDRAMAALADMRMAASTARHLSYEQMTAYLDGNADEETRAAIEGHIESCARCAEQWSELKKFAAEMGAAGQGVPSNAEKVPLRERIAELFRRPSYRLAMVGATAVVAFVVAVAIQTGRHSGGGAGQPQVATSGQPQQPGGTSSGELMSSNTQPGGKLDLPGGSLRDGDHDVTVVASNVWTPARTLTSGHRYVWQVAGMRKGSQLGTTPEALFVVLGDDAQLNLDQARRQYAVRPLVLGTVYEQNGLPEEARKQFSQLASENPGSVLAQKPVQQVQALLQPSGSLRRIP